MEKRKITQEKYQKQKQQWEKLCFYGHTNLAISNYNKLHGILTLDRSYIKVYVRTEVLVIMKMEQILRNDVLKLLDSDTLRKSTYTDELGNQDYYETSSNALLKDIKFSLGFEKLNKFKEICNKIRKTKDIVVIVHVKVQEADDTPIMYFGSYESPQFVSYSRPTKCHFIHPTSESQHM